MSWPDNPILRRNPRLGGAILLGLLVLLPAARPADPPTTSKVEAVFGKDCETLLIREIGKAEKEIAVAIYSITRRNIASALAKAVERGVKVSLKYDTASTEADDMKEIIKDMKKAGVKCTGIKMSEDYAKMHHKFTVIDGKRVLTGSYNYTSSATTANYENMVLIESPSVARLFDEEFDRIKSK